MIGGHRVDEGGGAQGDPPGDDPTGGDGELAAFGRGRSDGGERSGEAAGVAAGTLRVGHEMVGIQDCGKLHMVPSATNTGVVPRLF